MQIIHTIPELRAALAHSRNPAFVPTMGNLHDGHLALVRQARPLGDTLVASIFVNRLQFLPHEDFDSYPRTLQVDADKLRAAGCDVLFAPSEQDLYPEPQTFKVQPGSATGRHSGRAVPPRLLHRRVHGGDEAVSAVFAGKAQGTALFGQKDYQQLMVLRRMVQQFALPLDIVAGTTQRADDGLALSSRNGYLSEAERQEAVQLSLALRALARDAVAAAHALPAQREALEARALQALTARGWQPDYLTVRRRSDLQPPQAGDALVVLGAARLGRTRLIDNLEV
jgi:pantoate--beta-alanine ligase